MESETEKVQVLRYNEEGGSNIDDVVVIEFPLTIILNNQELVTVLCTPKDMKYLAVGFLTSEGLLKSKDDIKKIIVDEQKGIVRVETKEEKESDSELTFKRFITTGCGRGASFYSAADVRLQTKIESPIQILVPDVLSLANEFQQRSTVYRATHGVHSAALCDTKSIILFNEDIGRHNAIDKIFGKCLLEDIPMDDRIVITSGRISSEILLKVARRRIPVIVSKAAPTNLGVKLAIDLGMTLIGFAKGKRMNIYAHAWRIVDGK